MIAAAIPPAVNLEPGDRSLRRDAPLPLLYHAEAPDSRMQRHGAAAIPRFLGRQEKKKTKKRKVLHFSFPCATL